MNCEFPIISLEVIAYVHRNWFTIDNNNSNSCSSSSDNYNDNNNNINKYIN